MSPRWTTRLEARLGPTGVRLACLPRRPWGAGAPRWQQDGAAPASREDAPAALAGALVQARESLAAQGLAWPSRLTLELDDAWVLHSCLQGGFDRLGPAGAAEAAQRFVGQALGPAAGALRLALLPQPDGRSLWVSALPEALCQALAEAARTQDLVLDGLRPAAQRYLGGRARWPRDGVLALPQGQGWLLALRRQGCWVALAQDGLPGATPPTARADALLRFHGLDATAGRRWAVLPGDQAPPAGWTRASAGGADHAGAHR